MSWRIFFVAFLLGIATSIWGGIQLGNWLIESGPLKSDVFAAYQDLYTVPTLDADGKPYIPAPPQPLVDGRLAVPESPEPMAWEIDQNINLLTERPPIALATATGGIGAANISREYISPSGLQGLAQISRLQNQNQGAAFQPNQDVIQPIEIGAVPPPPSQEVQIAPLPIAANPNWQIDFHRELKACENKGTFARPSCAWDARNKYCSPNNAWGRIPGCPAKAF